MKNILLTKEKSHKGYFCSVFLLNVFPTKTSLFPTGSFGKMTMIADKYIASVSLFYSIEAVRLGETKPDSLFNIRL